MAADLSHDVDATLVEDTHTPRCQFCRRCGDEDRHRTSGRFSMRIIITSDLLAWPIGQKPAIANHQKPSQARAKEVA